MNKNHIGSDFDEFLLRELNDHLKTLISVSMENKRDLEYIKYKLDTLEKKSEDVNLINVNNTLGPQKLNLPRMPGFDVLSDRDE